MLTRNDENHVSVKIMTTHKIQRWAFIRMPIRLLLRMRNRGCHGTGTGKLVTTSGCTRLPSSWFWCEMAASVLQSKADGTETYTYSSQPHAAPQQLKFREK